MLARIRQRAGLGRSCPGCRATLAHGHAGSEITVVLQGSFSDQDGRYAQGDFLVRGPGDEHRPVAAADSDCLCLAVLDAPIRLGGLLGRLANPFLRIHPR